MNIKRALTLRFLILVALLLTSFSIVVYQNYANHRTEYFYERLNKRSNRIAKLMIDITNPDSLDEEIERVNILRPISNHKTSVFTMDGKLISDSSRKVEERLTEVIAEVKKSNSIEFITQKKQYVGFILYHNGNNYIVIASGQDMVGTNKLEYLEKTLILSLLIGLIITAVLGWFFAKQALNPINKLIKEVDQITANNLDKRLPAKKSNDEIDMLSNTFNKMLDRLEKSFVVQKNFVSNASHEFRTPITAIKAQIEVMLMQDRSNEEYINTLKSIDEDINHFIQLITGLSELARANSGEFDEKNTKVPLIEVVAESRVELLKGKPNYRINLQIENLPENEHENYVLGNLTLLKSAFKNLMENGCKFSQDHKCDVSIIFVEDYILITISDDGIGISSEELPLIFEPFFRANDTRGIAGHGIGLSLVKKIIDLHKGEVLVESTLSKGTKFIVKLPYMKLTETLTNPS
ncbi:MAG: HAMP domain-containing histidine kinase [Bacteroidia bacterium]|nr:HAMP domain-containing histidine kinase [Bacteroidia bacterium]